MMMLKILENVEQSKCKAGLRLKPQNLVQTLLNLRQTYKVSGAKDLFLWKNKKNITSCNKFGEKAEINAVKNEKSEITINSAKIQNIIRKYFEKYIYIYFNKLEDPKEIDF